MEGAPAEETQPMMMEEKMEEKKDEMIMEDK